MLIFFPPRLIEIESDGDINDRLNEVSQNYLDEGIIILGEEDSVKDAQKIINFSLQFESFEKPK